MTNQKATMTDQFTNPAAIMSATKRAAVMLRPSHESEADRAASLAEAAGLLHAAMTQAARAGRHDLAQRIHDLHLEAAG